MCCNIKHFPSFLNYFFFKYQSISYYIKEYKNNALNYLTNVSTKADTK